MKEIESKHFTNLEEALEWAVGEFEENNLFFGHGMDNAWDEAVFIACFAMGREELLTQDLTHKLNEAEAKVFIDTCGRRIVERKPAAYLVGEMYFAGLKFYVDENVLIPRSPLAELIQARFEPWLNYSEKPLRVLDLCTGSGCIGIAIKKYMPNTSVVLSDISEAALSIAKKNSVFHEEEREIETVKSDVFDSIDGEFDLIISNPPYVSYDSWEVLPNEYKHEPKLAFIADKNGLAIVERIVDESVKYLSDTGLLVVEVGDLAPLVEAHYPNLPLIWLEFENGGEGVFVIEAKALKALHKSLH